MSEQKLKIIHQAILSVRNRLLIAFALIILILLSYVVVTIIILTSTNNTSKHTMQITLPTYHEFMKINISMYQALASLRGWVLTHDKAFKTERELAWNDLDQTITHIDQYATQWTDKDKLKKWEEIKPLFSKFKMAQDKVESITNTNEAAQKLMTGPVPIYSKIFDVLNGAVAVNGQRSGGLLYLQHSQMQYNTQKTIHNLNNVKIIEYYLLIFSILLSIVVVFTTLKKFTVITDKMLSTAEDMTRMNELLSAHETALQDLNVTLEERVLKRTEELAATNNQLKNEIVIREKTEKKAEKMHQQLMITARQAGMSEVAATFLHNIGNILNSAGVSLVVLRESLVDSQIDKLEDISKMIQEGIFKDPNYLISDSKGKLIPAYLSGLSESLVAKKKEMINETEELSKHMDHIRDIVLMQNDISGISGVKEKISIEEICNQAIQMSYGLEENNLIKIIKNFAFKGIVFIDRTKILQILVNLIRNAKDSLMMKATEELKIINLSVQECGKGFFEIRISDNGVGIEKDYAKKIFSMGFTTKNHGHGFGLHMSAIAAGEMGGKLEFESNGKNQGATFILKMPIGSN